MTDQPLTGPELCAALRISRDQLSDLIGSGRVSYMKGARGRRLFFPEHVAEVRAALTVRATPPPTTDLTVPGQTSRSSRYRRTA